MKKDDVNKSKRVENRHVGIINRLWPQPKNRIMAKSVVGRSPMRKMAGISNTAMLNVRIMKNLYLFSNNCSTE